MGLVGGINVAGYNPRVLDEVTDAFYLEANGQIEALGKLRYNVGARYIKTDQFISGYISANTPTGSQRQYLEDISDYDKVLPSFNIASELGKGFLLRAAASRTMTRAQPGDIAPNQTLSVTGDVLTIGNPALAPYFSDNYDLGIEWYFGDEGLGVVALNAWRKEIEGYTTVVGTPTPFGELGLDFATLPIATQTGLQNAANSACQCTTGNPNDAMVRVDQRQNTSELITLNGWEFTYVQPLDMLLQGAGFSVNYTHIEQKSEGGLPGAKSSAIYGLSPYTYNVTAFYENFGFSGRIIWSVRDVFMEQFPLYENGMPADNFAQKRGYLDASFSYTLPMETNISLSLELQNLTNEALLTYYAQRCAHAARLVRTGPAGDIRYQRQVLKPAEKRLKDREATRVASLFSSGAGLPEEPGVEILAFVDSYPGEVPKVFVIRETHVGMTERFQAIEHGIKEPDRDYRVATAGEDPQG